MNSIKLVTNLLLMHGDSYLKCTGCDVCNQIEKLRSKIDRKPKDKYKEILSKADEMKRSEIIFLLENGVRKKEIAVALDCSITEFYQLLKNFGLDSRKYRDINDSKRNKITYEQYLDLSSKGQTDEQIAIIFSLKMSSVKKYKELWKKSLKKQIGLSS